ncbi:hypothetical protein APT65_00078 [Trabzonvirus APT65]|uniref:Uncharacterized protein n=1 Tax=Aeromonas phage APT65 TaxID=2982914 RepID=A0A9E8GA81_9CAUD|nr:hypothetical protein APT65_00078 [Aeromonas phage APT65]
MMTLDEKMLFRSLCDLYNHKPEMLQFLLDKLLEQQAHRRDEDLIVATMVVLQEKKDKIPSELGKIGEDYKAIYLHALEAKR